MATLLQQVVGICQRLAPFGWATLLTRHGFNIQAQDLEAEFYKDISSHINRDIKGFEDFISSGRRGIEPYVPAQSLLFHALASPDVHPGPGNMPVDNNNAYPTIEELEIIENFIFSTEHKNAGVSVRDDAFFTSNFKPDQLVIAVFAYQYRAGGRSVNRKYADFAYSRTGVARVGTDAFRYVPAHRTFWTISENGDNKIPVLPARYGVFLAEKRKKNKNGEVLLSKDPTIDNNDYLFPVHKLFAGANCIQNMTVPAFEFRENHFTEKLKRAFKAIDPTNALGFDIDKPPFIESSKNGRQVVQIKHIGNSALLVPVPSKLLIEVARQKNKVVHFVVPKETSSNRLFTSFAIPVRNNVRIGPEYLNIRFELKDSGEFENISDQFSANEQEAYMDKINKGGYRAVQFTDNTCDGCIVPEFNSAPPFNKTVIPAYSLVTAPDFFPLCDQLQITNWLAENGIDSEDHFAKGGPEPLCDDHFPVNPFIENPLNNKSAFGITNSLTTTAIVGMSVFNNANTVEKRKNQQVSFLTDAASGAFAPGWDVSVVRDPSFNMPFLSSFGLGSPFPEDSKLCAALNSFWPAVAPDASRTFMFRTTSFPMLDVELGFYDKHPMVLQGKVQASLGWDGEQGPYFEENFNFVNYAGINRSDYTANALKNNISLKQLCLVDADEWIRRMMALRHCIFVLPPTGDRVSLAGDPIGDRNNPLPPLQLVTAQKVEKWEEHPGRADIRLFGEGFIFQFAILRGPELTTEDPRRARRAISQWYNCQISETFLFWSENGEKTFKNARRATIPMVWPSAAQ